MIEIETGRAYKTGEVSKLLDLSLNTVIRLCNSGDLQCRRIPGSRHRRIEGVWIRQFLEKHPDFLQHLIQKE